MPDGSSKCYVMFQDLQRSWDEMMRKCEEESLLTAKPSLEDDAIILRKYLLDRYGIYMEYNYIYFP